MRRAAACVVAGGMVAVACLGLRGLGRPELALGALGCVACAVGVRHLVSVTREAARTRPSAVVVLALVTAGLLVVGLSVPEAWPLLVLGYPSCGCVVVEAWLHTREGLAGQALPHGEHLAGAKGRKTARGKAARPRIATS